LSFFLSFLPLYHSISPFSLIHSFSPSPYSYLSFSFAKIIELLGEFLGINLTRNVETAMHQIRDQLSQTAEHRSPLFFVIHNLDAEAFRQQATQTFFASLVQIKKVYREE